MSRRIRIGAVVLLTLGGVLDWLTASGRLDETFAQETNVPAAVAGRTQRPSPDPAFKGKVGETYKDSTTSVNGVKQMPMHGVSMAYTYADEAAMTRRQRLM